MNKEKLFISNKNMPEDILAKRVFLWFYTFNPHVVFWVYAPLAFFILIYSYYFTDISLPGMLLGFSVAIAFWTLFEYSMHRFVFHWESDRPLLNKILYTVHHGHHEYPNDSRLMLVAPFISLFAFVLIYGLVYLIAGIYAHPFMGGMAICYMFYDWLHYASHHYNFKNPIFQKLKIHHMRHHYEDNERNFGFTSVLWDVIMDTWLKWKK